MLPIPLIGQNVVENFISKNADYWFRADNELFQKDIVSDVVFTVNNNNADVSYTSFSQDNNNKFLDVILDGSSFANYEIVESTLPDFASEFTIFTVKKNPPNSLQFGNWNNTTFEAPEFQLLSNTTTLGHINSIAQQIPYVPTDGKVSRYWIGYVTQLSSTPPDYNKIVADIKNEFGANYNPDFGQKYIDVIRVTQGTPGFGDYVPNIYLTRNGRGSSGSPFHKFGSFIQTTTTGGTSNSVNRIRFYNYTTTGLTPRMTWGETIVFNRALNQQEINIIERYLAEKYNVEY